MEAYLCIYVRYGTKLPLAATPMTAAPMASALMATAPMAWANIFNPLLCRLIACSDKNYMKRHNLYAEIIFGALTHL